MRLRFLLLFSVKVSKFPQVKSNQKSKIPTEIQEPEHKSIMKKTLAQIIAEGREKRKNGTVSAEEVPLVNITAECPSQRVDIVPKIIPRFDCNDSQFLSYFENYGYVVIRSVANEYEIKNAQDLFWSFLLNKANMHEDDNSTWTDLNFRKVGSISSGIISGGGIGQSDFMWYMRSLPKVTTAFSLLHNTEDLLTSFDGANIFRPWHARDGSKLFSVCSYNYIIVFISCSIRLHLHGMVPRGPRTHS